MTLGSPENVQPDEAKNSCKFVSVCENSINKFDIVIKNFLSNDGL